MFGILEAVTIPHGNIFSSSESLIANLNERMEKEGYKIVKSRSHRAYIGGAEVPGNDTVRCDLVCDRGGRPYKSVATKHKTSTKKTGCPWKAKAVHRKAAGGWVLTVVCDQHNHEPGTPEPPSPEQSDNEEGDEEDSANDLPSLDAETSAAIQVAGVSEAAVRLTGDTFNKFKGEYRKLSGPDRMQVLSTLQLRVAAIYALQNEDMQRHRRREAQDRRHRDIESNKRPQEEGAVSTSKRQKPSTAHDQDAGTEALQSQMHPDVAHGLMGATQFQFPPRAPPQIQVADAAAQTSLSIPNSGMGGFPQFANSFSRGRRPNT
ncbi:Transcription factor, FAR1-related protein [Akanthomyces lecanii RCEF 1005]|uniref:Transcription factor, FAR1-related protein n=1 Tax=Akanthomyces lecanii RCEF 1005 TaxID=1081108 RepID=A0A168GQS4_CORDF|nr:Transcription factor, FAR1-related protein [Akanthomyces lecanii RCEF 1005]